MPPTPEQRVLRPEDYARAATALGCEVAVIRAVAEVEGGHWGAFLESGEPVQLFERHLMHRLTQGRFDEIVPDLSDPKPGGYGLVSMQPGRVERASKLDRDAALKATSWGLFQILGLNYANAGHPDLQSFVNAMYRGAGDHLDAFVAVVRTFKLDGALRSLDWATFKRRYNGPAENDYAYKMRMAYERIKGER